LFDFYEKMNCRFIAEVFLFTKTRLVFEERRQENTRRAGPRFVRLGFFVERFNSRFRRNSSLRVSAPRASGRGREGIETGA
jgi:hypothetical protein